MKKTVFILLALLCLLFLSACQQNKDSSHPQETSHVHSPAQAVLENSLEATCVEDGHYEEVVYCAECEEELSRIQEPVSALGHQYKDIICQRCGAEKPSEGLRFRSNGNGTCTVTGIGSCTDEDVIIPAISPQGETVTAIGDSAFYYLTGLRSIRMPDTVTSIGKDAFGYCSNVLSILLSENLQSVGSGAFGGCSQLQRREQDGLRYLSTRTNPCFLLTGRCEERSTYLINPHTRFIYGGAFSNCDTLTELVIPDSILNIGAHAFQECDELVRVTLSKSITIIPDGLFAGCRKLEHVELPRGVTKIGQQAFMYCKELQEITLTGSLKTIEENAFYFCSSLTQVDLPDSLTFLGGSVFKDCEKLETVTLPRSITSIPASTFRNCVSLKAIEIPATVKSIGKGAFYNCRALENVIIPAAVNTIGVDAFKMSGVQQVLFEKPNGWMLCERPEDTVGEEISNLNDPAWAAMTINLRFNDYTWKRK